MSMSDKSSAEGQRLRFASDPYRPAYHFLAPSCWMNDPNGTIFWKGRYHLFYQYNPHGAYWASPYWGHAVSTDLVHWADLPPALAPERNHADEAGCFSGTAFADRDGTVSVIYYGNPHGICIARSRDDMLVQWEKHPANPVIPHPTHGEEYRVYDPCAWLEGDTYYALSGSITPARPLGAQTDGRDVAYLFSSKDLTHWDYLHPFYEGGRFTAGGEDCAVPQFFPFGDKHMLLFASHSWGAQCYVGDYRDHRLYPLQHKRLVNRTGAGRIGVFNEGLSLLDGAGRRILFGRISEGRYGHVQRASGWSGIFALPMLLSLDGSGELRMEPVPELVTLRRYPLHATDVRLESGKRIAIEGASGDRMEIRALFEWEDAEEFGLRLACSGCREEETLIRFNTNPNKKNTPADKIGEQREVVLDTTRSSTNTDACARESQSRDINLPYGEPVELRVFLDRSVVEVFVNSREYLAKRIYPSHPQGQVVELFAVGGRATARSVDVWRMEAIWPVA
jgi:beta-fructofuranosidase